MSASSPNAGVTRQQLFTEAAMTLSVVRIVCGRPLPETFSAVSDLPIFASKQ